MNKYQIYKKIIGKKKDFFKSLNPSQMRACGNGYQAFWFNDNRDFISCESTSTTHTYTINIKGSRADLKFYDTFGDLKKEFPKILEGFLHGKNS